MTKYYEQINVFRREDDRIEVYRCFKDLGTSLYYVQNKDYLYPPFEEHKLTSLSQNLCELMFEDDLAERTEGFERLDDAIKAFEIDFQ